MTSEATVQITTFEMSIFYWDGSGEHTQIYDIANYRFMTNGENFIRQVQFTVPSTDVWHRIGVNFRIDTDEVSDFFVGVFTTRIVEKTYQELESENSDLLYNYTNLEIEHESYKDTHSHSDYEYSNLNSTCNQYMESHSYSNGEYDNLQSSYNDLNRELGLAKNLDFVLIAMTIVFIGTTIFFAKRKPKS